MLSNGRNYNVTHTVGSASLPFLSRPLHLSNALCVPQIKKNLILIYKLCSSKNVMVEFSPFSSVMKDYYTRVPLVERKPKDGVYEWLIASNLSLPTLQVFHTITTSTLNWQWWLSHPSTTILHHFSTHLNLPISSLDKSFFQSLCKCNKMHKTPFSTSSIQSSLPLELIYLDFQGPFPITSIDRFQYYIIFIDHLKIYIWLFPLKRKYDVSIIFPKFKRVVKKYFQISIIFYSNNGGKFLHLHSFFEENGIPQFLTPSIYTKT